jgi:hypothetical protein
MPASVSYFDFQRQKDDRYFKPIFYCQSIRSKTYSRWQKTNHPGVRRFKSSPRPFIFVRYANSQDLKISVGVHERIPLVSGCSLEYRAREMSGVSLLLLQETEPYFQDSGEDRTSSSILETTIWFEGCRHKPAMFSAMQKAADALLLKDAGLPFRADPAIYRLLSRLSIPFFDSGD